MSATIHTFGLDGHRTIARTIGPLFNRGTLQWLTAQAVHYATVEGDQAMRFALTSPVWRTAAARASTTGNAPSVTAA